ncbi:putative (+)-menthofuran synthase [Helianthus annuus]|nr:putative (+)-menthofuran synthase [Helianthus annuus]
MCNWIHDSQDLFGAGTETTFTNLEWAISELLKNPHAMKELQQEARKVGKGRLMIPEDDIDKMPYLKAVIKETLVGLVPFVHEGKHINHTCHSR